MDDRCPVCDNLLEFETGVCPACGFKLTESTQSFKPVSLTEHEIISACEKQPTKAILRVIRGPQIEMTFHLEEGEYELGRSPQCKIFLNDMTVSRNHALIFQTDDGFHIKDCKSYNGVWINNVSINEAKLKEGDIIQTGAFCLLYRENNKK
ncbi:MAG: FHA domain-containing protein [Eggerthellaceae bacterium]|nr:FHA domain-containing protein [Eggerthellaceae bacterium]